MHGAVISEAEEIIYYTDITLSGTKKDYLLRKDEYAETISLSRNINSIEIIGLPLLRQCLFIIQ